MDIRPTLKTEDDFKPSDEELSSVFKAVDIFVDQADATDAVAKTIARLRAGVDMDPVPGGVVH